MNKIEVGKTYGCWTVIKDYIYLYEDKKYWLCKCNCENPIEKYIYDYRLRTSEFKTCNYAHSNQLEKENRKKREKEFIHIGDTFKNLTVIGDFILKEVSGIKRRFWLCECNCKNKTRKYIGERNLLNGMSTSCGCYRKENLSKLHKGVIKVKLSDKFANINNVWSDKNIKCPCDYSTSSKSHVWWKCENEAHEDFRREIRTSIVSEFRCPYCSMEKHLSFLHKKVDTYLLNSLNYRLNYEHNCSIMPINPKTKNGLPFDIEIIDLKLIIEVHGIQHYKLLNDKSPWLNNQTPESYLKQRKLYDRYKKAVAECNGYFYLEIPYWTEKNESYKLLIDNKINEILNIKSNIAS